MLVDPDARGLVRTISKSLKQCDPAALSSPIRRLTNASGAETPRRLRQCESLLRGMEVHLRTIVELVDAGGPVPGTDRARLAGIVASQRSDFEARCAGELALVESRAAGADTSAWRARCETVRGLFDQLERSLSAPRREPGRPG